MKRSVNKSVEFFTTKDCEACDIALHAIMPIIKNRHIPITVKPITDGILAPSVCVITRDEEGKQHRDCIDGLVSNYGEVFSSLLDD